MGVPFVSRNSAKTGQCSASCRNSRFSNPKSEARNPKGEKNGDTHILGEKRGHAYFGIPVSNGTKLGVPFVLSSDVARVGHRLADRLHKPGFFPKPGLWSGRARHPVFRRTSKSSRTMIRRFSRSGTLNVGENTGCLRTLNPCCSRRNHRDSSVPIREIQNIRGSCSSRQTP